MERCRSTRAKCTLNLVVDDPPFGAHVFEKGDDLLVRGMWLIAVERGAGLELGVERDIRRIRRVGEVDADSAPDESGNHTNERLEATFHFTRVLFLRLPVCRALVQSPEHDVNDHVARFYIPPLTLRLPAEYDRAFH